MVLKACNHDVKHTTELLDISKQTFLNAISCNEDGKPEVHPIGRRRKLDTAHYLHIDILFHFNREISAFEIIQKLKSFYKISVRKSIILRILYGLNYAYRS
jgi:hypothetical protein